MTLDNAIAHADLVADNCEGECAEDHRQLSEWLRELKRLREERDEMRTNEMLAILGQDTLKTIVDRLRAENEKLRELVRDLHKALFTLDIDHCQACTRDNINGPCTKFEVWGSDECSIEEVMRELGIEVE